MAGILIVVTVFWFPMYVQLFYHSGKTIFLLACIRLLLPLCQISVGFISRVLFLGSLFCVIFCPSQYQFLSVFAYQFCGQAQRFLSLYLSLFRIMYFSSLVFTCKILAQSSLIQKKILLGFVKYIKPVYQFRET